MPRRPLSAPVLVLLVVGCSNPNPRGICPDVASGTGTWAGSVGGLSPGTPATDGTRLFAWFCDSSECWLGSSDSQGQAIATADPPNDARRDRGSVAAGVGHVLILGGMTDRSDPTSYATSALLYDIAGDSWVEVAHPVGFLAGMNHEIVWTGREFLTWGGWREPASEGAQPHGELEAGARIDPTTGTWRSITDNGRPDGQGPMIWTSQGLFLWTYSPEQMRPSAWLYAPEDDEWEAVAVDPSITPRYAFLAASDEAVYVVGGDTYTYGEYYRYSSTETWIREVWEFRLIEQTWNKMSLPGDAAVGMLTHFIDGRLYLFDSSCAPGSFYTPATGEWGATSWPDDLSWPLYLLEIDGKVSLYGSSGHFGSYGSFFQFTP